MINFLAIKPGQVKTFFFSHVKSSIFILIIFVLVGYFGYKNLFPSVAQVQYMTAQVEKGSVISSITGSGQVSASNQIDLKSKASGTIVYVGVKAGDVVKRGRTLFSLDSRDAQKNVRDAESNLEVAKLDLEKFTKAPLSVDVLTINNAILDAENSKSEAEKTVKNTYTNLLNSVFEAVPHGNITDYTAPTISGNYVLNKEGSISINVYYTSNGQRFSVSGLTTGDGIITSGTPQPIGDSGLYIKFPTTINMNISQWDMSIPNKKATNYTSNLTSYNNALDNQEKVDRNADLTIAQQKQKLSDLYSPDSLDLRTKQVSIQQKQDALIDARNTLSDYYVTAPFDGIMASLIGKVGDISSGTLGTIITNQKVATISLNEVDIAKIKLGQKATVTFDAIDGLTITGEVSEIDSVGTVSQGVVNYNVKITLDTQDDRVKSGMSVSASIITDIAQDVLVVPNSAIKKQNGASYVNTFASPFISGSTSLISPDQVTVETGLSNDSSTEIISGLNEGDVVVTKTIIGSTAAAKSTTPSLLNAVGGSRTGGRMGGSAGMAIPHD